MEKSKQRAREFLQKEIKTYTALALFLAKRGIEDRVRFGRKTISIGPTFYKDRMKEARKLANELKNT
jgi:hypothetical protein